MKDGSGRRGRQERESADRGKSEERRGMIPPVSVTQVNFSEGEGRRKGLLLEGKLISLPLSPSYTLVFSFLFTLRVH